LIVGTDSATPPFCFKDEAGNWTGFDIDFAKELATGLFDKPDAIEFVDEKPSSRIPNLQADKVDFVIQAMTITMQRAQLVNFTVPYYRDAINIVLPKKSQYDNYTQLQGAQYKIAILQNRDADDTVHRFMPDAQVIQFETQAAAVLAEFREVQGRQSGVRPEQLRHRDSRRRLAVAVLAEHQRQRPRHGPALPAVRDDVQEVVRGERARAEAWLTARRLVLLQGCVSTRLERRLEK
jgi:hypothetical protein